ncbi:MAG: HNH endonuclease [Chloroflexi bacterium]|nr:HNH endonuclease [Chloroflexota bacterium]
MHPRRHLLISTAAALASTRRRRAFPWAFWAASILADLDHFIWYAIRAGDVNPLAAWRHFRSEPTVVPENRLPFHRYSVVFGCFWLGNRQKWLYEVGWGLAFHRGLDDLTAFWRNARRIYANHQRQRLRAVVFAREHYACQHCGARGVPLELHHRIPENQGGPNHPDNLLALCQPCHDRAHGREVRTEREKRV